MPDRRPDFIKHVSELPDNGGTVWPGSDEVLSIRTPLSRPLGLVRIGVHYELLEPGHRTSLPHAEIGEEECVYVLEGHPHAWIDGEQHALAPDDVVVFAPGTGIEHTIVNRSEQNVRLLVIGERAGIRRPRIRELLAWVAETHPEVGDAMALPESRLLELADEFEGGKIASNGGLREAWRVGFMDHVFPKPSDFD